MYLSPRTSGTATIVGPAPVGVMTTTEPGLETSQQCDLCDEMIEAGSAAAVLYYANSHGFAHAECIDLIRLPTETARLL